MTLITSDAIDRALHNYFRSGYCMPQPSKDSGVVKHLGREYVVLRNCNGMLAVYSIARTGRVRRVEQWPRGLADS
jgi:hypothetical protein